MWLFGMLLIFSLANQTDLFESEFLQASLKNAAPCK